jgi:hypothetical protein
MAMTPFLASPARDSQIAGRSKGPSSHESEAEFIEMQNRLVLIFTAHCPVEGFSCLEADYLLILMMEKGVHRMASAGLYS